MCKISRNDVAGGKATLNGRRQRSSKGKQGRIGRLQCYLVRTMRRITSVGRSSHSLTITTRGEVAQIGCETVALKAWLLAEWKGFRISDAPDSPTKRIHQDQIVS